MFCRYAPLGIMFLVAAKIVEMDDVGTLFASLGKYIACCVIGHAVHGLVILPLIYFVITRRNPYTFLMGLIAALATAFGTSSRYELSLPSEMSMFQLVTLMQINHTGVFQLIVTLTLLYKGGWDVNLYDMYVYVMLWLCFSRSNLSHLGFLNIFSWIWALTKNNEHMEIC